MTWFRRDERIIHLYIDEMPYDELLKTAVGIIERGIAE